VRYLLSVNKFKDQILIFEVSKKFSTGYEDLYYWSQSTTPKSRFTIDILKAKDLAQKEGIFYHIERSDRKICFFLFQNMFYLVGSEKETQFQLLEAIIEEASQEFSSFYRNKLEQREAGFAFEQKDFNKKFEYIIEGLKHIVTVVFAPCPVCGCTITILAKNSIVNRLEQRIPVPLVYTHKGHSLLIYLDKQFNVRGAEIVDISS
jgi:hypothetical protein